MKIYITSCLLIILSLSTTAYGQTTLSDTSTINLAEIIITENRLQIPFAKQNRNIHIITRDEIAASPARSINELLAYVAGIDVRQRGPWGAQADISIDGGTFDQTLILVNGVKMNDPQTGHNSMSLPIPTDAIERIEIIRGPAARIYGINSLTGAINIVTRKVANSGIEGRVYAGSSFKSDEESDDLYNSRGVQLGGRIAGEHGRHLLYGGYDGGNGYRYNTDFLNTKLFYQGDAIVDQDDLLSWTAGYAYNNFGANAFYAAPGDSNSQEIIQTALGSIQYTSQLNEKWTLTPRIAYRFAYDDYRYLKDDLSKYRNMHRSQVISYEFNSRYRGNFGELGFGAELRNDIIRSTSLGDRNRFNYGFYGEFRADKVDRLSLSLGAYLNYNSDFGWRVYPGLDAGYNFYGNWKVFVNTGTGQRIPTFTDLYYQGAGNRGNPNLTSENAYYAEGGLKFIGPKWQLNASYFYRRIDDFIDWTRKSLEDPWVPDNFLQNNTNGVNLSISYRWPTQQPSNGYITFAYNYLDPKFKQYDDNNLSRYAIESLRHQAVAMMNYHIGKVGLTAAERFVERISYRRYFLTDVRATLSLGAYQLYLDANNIFDKRYIEAAAVPMPGRWVSLGLKYALR
ncbi:TonB-dependent receptor plug domain-containing protein [Parapedobacter tibetensis]|uniref:TonB-dependent receptor plug domain-containing protein n=1 Tax=Parapedobacter tibetensis TaxID=2972951 RepID=UPI00214D8139|nr:TonB-dependent receptor [Parapedobacter tibetensis]